MSSEMRAGLEIHRQLATRRKMFCECPTNLRTDEPAWVVRRMLRPSFSEMGEIDEAALAEVRKRKTHEYQGYATNCLVEIDEEPPHLMDSELFEIATTVALLLRADIVEELHTMRKVVLDGSNTSGFQRTMLFATGGKVETRWGDVEIPILLVEEDAARIISEDEETRVFRLDRLGIPELEITTSPTMTNPEQVKLVASHIGQILRATKKVRRGIGTIRQDINISIPEGDRVELKGVQDLDGIPLYIESEIVRQKNLASIAKELQSRGLSFTPKGGNSKTPPPEIEEATHLFDGSQSRLLKGKRVFAMRLEKFGGLLGREVQKNRRLATEFADMVRSITGGLLHSDELPAYGITQEEVAAVRDFLGLGREDGFVMVTGEEEKARTALVMIAQRAHQAVGGVPRETREIQPDGTSRFLRPLPGAARMYPETDIPPVVLGKGFIDKVKSNLPELPQKKRERLVAEYSLNEENVDKIIRSGFEDLFEEVVKNRGLKATSFVRITETLRSVAKEMDVSLIDEDKIRCLSEMMASGKVTNEGMEDAVRALAEGRGVETGAVSDREAEIVIQEIVDKKSHLIAERGEEAISPLMGEVMKVLRGKVDGSRINEILKRKIAEKMKKK